MGLFEDVRKKVVPIDGAIGTMCHERGLASSRPPEWYNITSPEIVKEIHTAYAEAGAQLLTTNTFGGNGIKLASWNLHGNLDEINAVAVRLAREVARTQLYVAGSMGPTGKLVEPLGELSFEDAYRSFADQVEVLQREGVDVILIETMGDLQEARAAVLAVRENSVLPVIASFTFEATSRTVSGDTPEAVAVVMEALGVDGIGVNCVGDLDLLVRVAARMAGSTHLPLMVKPSAGTPQFLSGATVFPVTPEEIVKRVDELVESGANLIGGCCGTTPQHIALLSKSVSRKRPRRRIRKKIARLASRSRVVEIDRHISVIGELINPTGRKRLREDLSKGQTGVSKNLAMMQSRAGADILDVNVAVPLTNEVSSMARVVKALSSTVETPLSIDSSDPEVIEQGLRLFPGKALLNSTTGEEEKLRTLLPLARKYGACVICLTMDEKGIPATAEGCLDIARRIVNAGKDEGVDRSDMIIDPLVLSAGAQPERVGETLRALTSIKKKLKMKTVLGISNVSYGLPDRSEMNAAFLSMAVASGVDLVIIDPLDERVSKSLSAASLLMRRSWRGEEVPGTNLKAPASLKEQLREAVLFGDGERAESAALELLDVRGHIVARGQGDHHERHYRPHSQHEQHVQKTAHNV